jgi:hypothetical protein
MEQSRVAFRFEGDTEVHYVRELPTLGDFVTHRGEMWVVSNVEMNDTGALVTCERPARDDAQSAAARAAGRT